MLAERRLHSVATAAGEAGIGHAVMEEFPIRAGAIAAGDPRPAARRTFPAAPHAALIAEIPTLIGALGLRRAMGAKQNEFEALVADGVLAPRAPGVSPEDIAAFHRRFLTLRTMATEVGTGRDPVIARLDAAGVRRFAPGGVEHGPIWLRVEVETALRRPSGGR